MTRLNLAYYDCKDSGIISVNAHGIEREPSDFDTTLHRGVEKTKSRLF